MKNTPKKADTTLEYRVSVSLSSKQHEFLSQLAERKRVSLAWVIRDAIEHLKKAVENGFKDAENLAKDKDLHALRKRPDFIKLMAELAIEPKKNDK